MQKLIGKYGLAAHLALVVVAPPFFSPAVVLWLSALAVLWIVMEPSRIGFEQLHDARARVFSTMRRDPVFWLFLALVVVAGVRFANGGVTLAYDAESASWSVASPRWEFLPGCVDEAGFPFFAGIVAMFVAVAGCRHALGRSARLAFLLVASSLSAIGAGTMLAMCDMGSSWAIAASKASFEHPVFFGSVFGVHLSGAVVALYAAFEHRWFKAMPFAAFALCGNAAGLFVFAPPLVHCFFASAAIVVFLYTFVFARLTLLSRGEFKFLVVFGVSLVVGAMVVMGLLGDAFLQARVEPYVTGVFLSQDFMSLRSLLSSVSVAIWKSCPWFGGGLGSYAMELGFHAAKDSWAIIPPAQSAPLNGYLMLLAERGIVGAFLVVVPALLLVGFYVRALVAGVRRSMPHPAAWAGLLVFAAAVAEALFTATPFTPGMCAAVVSYLAVSTNAFPKEK